MGIEVLFFGQLAEITKCSTLDLEYIGTTDKLKEIVFGRFPELSSVKFAMALNNEIVIENTAIKDQSKVAFMSPFSGG